MAVRESVTLDFFIQIFETHFAPERIPKDLYDIRAMIPLITKKFDFDILDLLKITHSFKRSKIVELMRVSPPNLKSKHVYICSPGFF
jgi:hypothetical protein